MFILWKVGHVFSDVMERRFIAVVTGFSANKLCL